MSRGCVLFWLLCSKGRRRCVKQGWALSGCQDRSAVEATRLRRTRTVESKVDATHNLKRFCSDFSGVVDRCWVLWIATCLAREGGIHRVRIYQQQKSKS